MSKADSLMFFGYFLRPPPAHWFQDEAKSELLAGMILLTWFGSFYGHGTLGDLLALQAAADAIAAIGLPVAYAAPTDFGLRICGERVEWNYVDPRRIDTLVFVCGPILLRHPEQRRLFARFRHCRKICVGVSLFPRETADYWDPFDEVFAREGTSKTWSDIASAAPVLAVVEPHRKIVSHSPVIGLCLRGEQTEYTGRRCLSDQAASVLMETAQSIISERGGSVMKIEHHLHRNPLQPSEILAKYGQCSLLLTTRLHGALLAALHGVPSIAIDQIEGGAKVSGILQGSGWPFVYRIESLDASLVTRVARELIDAPPVQTLDAVRTKLVCKAKETLDAFVKCLVAPRSIVPASSIEDRSKHDRIAFVFCAEAGLIERHSLLLAESIRSRAGRFCNAPIYAVCPRRGRGISVSTRKRFQSLAVHYIEEPLNVRFFDYPLVTNKPIAARFIEENCDHDVIVALDTDTCFLNEPTALHLATHENVALRPADMRGIALTKEDTLFQDYWKSFSKLAGVDITGVPTITTGVDQCDVTAYYQTGLVAVRRRLGIFRTWADLLEVSLGQGLIPGLRMKDAKCSTGRLTEDETLAWGADIAALTFAIWGLTDRVRLLPRGYNYPLHLLEQIARHDQLRESRDIVHVHYHWMFNAIYLDQNLLRSDEFDLDPAIRKMLNPYIPMDTTIGNRRFGFPTDSVRHWLRRFPAFLSGRRR